jgi:two-component system chemotaxis response regulator CheY
MKTLIVEDDFSSSLILQEILKDYGSVHTVVNGREAVAAFRLAMEDGVPFDLVCLDIMMAEMDGQQALKEIRDLEEARGIILSRGSRIIMTTALADVKSILGAFSGLCDGYLIKPLDKAKLLAELGRQNLIPL